MSMSFVCYCGTDEQYARDVQIINHLVAMQRPAHDYWLLDGGILTADRVLDSHCYDHVGVVPVIFVSQVLDPAPCTWQTPSHTVDVVWGDRSWRLVKSPYPRPPRGASVLDFHVEGW